MFVSKRCIVFVGVALSVLLVYLSLALAKEPGKDDRLFSLAHGGLTRKYTVHLPPGYDRRKKMPVVIYLHGGGGSMKAAYRDGIDKASDKFGFILVIPAGTGRFPRILTWNGGEWLIDQGRPEAESCCGYASENNIDDVGFISKMIAQLKKDFHVDENRIYATGLSNGGIMSYRLACELSDQIAAIAAVAPPATPDMCAPRRAVSVMHIHGTADPCAPYKGGMGRGRLIGKRRQMQSAARMVDAWKGIHGCSAGSSVVYKKGQATCISTNECRDRAEVVFCAVEGMGHAYPSGAQYFSKRAIGPVSYDISFEQIWDFFKRHSLKE